MSNIICTYTWLGKTNEKIPTRKNMDDIIRVIKGFYISNKKTVRDVFAL